MEGIDALWAQLGITPELVSARGLPRYPEAAELVVVEVDPLGREHQLSPEAARAWRRMRAAAAADGVEMHIVSAFRSVARQAEIIAAKPRAGQSMAAILSVSAPPGCSEHHTGRAVDIGSSEAAPLELQFETTAAYLWLKTYASDYGFELSFPRGNRWGYDYEPWHWCYRA